MKNYKKILAIISFIIIALVGMVIFFGKPKYEKVKQKLESTKYIIVYDLTKNDKLKINDMKTVKEITTILNDAKIDNSGWETLTGNKYKLDFYNNAKKLSEALINTNDNNPVHIKYKSHDYSLKVKKIESLNSIIDNLWN